MEMAPTKKSATARLANKMFEFFCDCLLFATATITKTFKRMIIGQVMHFVVIAAWNVVVSLKIHENIGSFLQVNTSGAWLETFMARFDLPWFILFPHGRTQEYIREDTVLTQ